MHPVGVAQVQRAILSRRAWSMCTAHRCGVQMPRPADRNSSLYFTHPQYPFAMPPELRGASPVHDVAIVGAGPVGLTAALELARHGVSCVVLDEKGTLHDGSRAICIA